MKQFSAGGFFYNASTKKILLSKDLSSNHAQWVFFCATGKGLEAPEKVLQAEIYQQTKIRVLLKALAPLYDYFDDEFKMPRFVFFIPARSIKGLAKLKKLKNFQWVGIEDAFKLDLTPRCHQDLTFFYRELMAKTNRRPTATL